MGPQDIGVVPMSRNKSTADGLGVPILRVPQLLIATSPPTAKQNKDYRIKQQQQQQKPNENQKAKYPKHKPTDQLAG